MRIRWCWLLLLIYRSMSIETAQYNGFICSSKCTSKSYFRHWLQQFFKRLTILSHRMKKILSFILPIKLNLKFLNTSITYDNAHTILTVQFICQKGFCIKDFCLKQVKLNSIIKRISVLYKRFPKLRINTSINTIFIIKKSDYVIKKI